MLRSSATALKIATTTRTFPVARMQLVFSGPFAPSTSVASLVSIQLAAGTSNSIADGRNSDASVQSVSQSLATNEAQYCRLRTNNVDVVPAPSSAAVTQSSQDRVPLPRELVSKSVVSLTALDNDQATQPDNLHIQCRLTTAYRNQQPTLLDEVGASL